MLGHFELKKSSSQCPWTPKLLCEQPFVTWILQRWLGSKNTYVLRFSFKKNRGAGEIDVHTPNLTAIYVSISSCIFSTKFSKITQLG